MKNRFLLQTRQADALSTARRRSEARPRIEQYFPEFIAFFFPQAHRDIDRTKKYEFLNKELRQITKDAEIGRKYVDKLVRVWLKNGEDARALIHADVQTQHEKNFAERMYIYNYRLFDRYRRHAASFAVLGDAGKKWRPETYKQELWGCKVRFEFPAVKLSDYGKDWESLKADNNPFAVVVRAHLLTQKTAGDHDRRKNEKLTLIKELYRKGFSKQDIINLFHFIDWIMASAGNSGSAVLGRNGSRRRGGKNALHHKRRTDRIQKRG